MKQECPSLIWFGVIVIIKVENASDAASDDSIFPLQIFPQSFRTV